MVKIVLNKNGVRSLLKSQEMKNFCETKANEIKNKCGNGYETSAFVGKTRVNASIGASSHKAMLDNSENNTILKNMR